MNISKSTKIQLLGYSDGTTGKYFDPAWQVCVIRCKKT